MTELKTLTANDFEKHLDCIFEIKSLSPPLKLSLVEVSQMGAGEREGGTFSLLWQGPQKPVLEQATYRLSQSDLEVQEGLGEQDIFLVPVAEKPEGIQYEAIFT